MLHLAANSEETFQRFNQKHLNSATKWRKAEQKKLL